MKAVLVRGPGGAEELELGEHPTPSPGPQDLLVRVKATALNRADLLQRQGKYPPPPGASPLLGMEVAGVVEQVGAECGGWSPGDRAFGLIEGGGYAEYAVLPCGLAMRIPESLSFEEAAAIPEVFLTAHQCLFWMGELKAGEHVLVHAGASGVGTAAIQLARDVGARVFATAGSAEKLDVCRQLGADVVINYREESFSERVLPETGGVGVDVILDPVGASYWDQNARVAGLDARWIVIATLGGSRVERFDLRLLMRQRLQIKGTMLRSRSLAYKTELTRDFAARWLPLFERGELRPVIDRVLPFDQVAEAHRVMEENRNIGKIVLTLA